MKKLNLLNAQETLSRGQMKQIMAGSGDIQSCGVCNSQGSVMPCYNYDNGSTPNSCRCPRPDAFCIF